MPHFTRGGVANELRQITIVPTFEGWQSARRALNRDQAAEDIVWEELGSEQPALSMFEEPDHPTGEGTK